MKMEELDDRTDEEILALPRWHQSIRGRDGKYYDPTDDVYYRDKLHGVQLTAAQERIIDRYFAEHPDDEFAPPITSADVDAELKRMNIRW